MQGKINFRRLISAGLALVAAICLLTACGDAGITASSAPETVSVATTVATEPAPTTVTTTTATSGTPATQKTTFKTENSLPLNPRGHYVQKTVPSWELRLVNPWNPLPSDWNYTANLGTYAKNKEFDRRAMDALKKMIKDGAAHRIYAVSLYRPYSLQVSLFDRQVAKVKKNYGLTGTAAELKAATVVARPGTSEHHLGLAADILGDGQSALEEYFDKTAAFRWLKEHCADYGFILRYPKEKESITGVIYEPWHYRYVGVTVAKEIMARGISLEEYLEEKDTAAKTTAKPTVAPTTVVPSTPTTTSPATTTAAPTEPTKLTEPTAAE